LHYFSIKFNPLLIFYFGLQSHNEYYDLIAEQRNNNKFYGNKISLTTYIKNK